MSYLGREGSPLAQRPVNMTATKTATGKSPARVERSLSASPLPEVELSGAVKELVLENEKLIGETIVLRGSYKAVVEKCNVYLHDNAKLKEELNMLRNELGLAHDAVTNKDGSVVNYKKQCESLTLIVERQQEEIDKLKATIDGEAHKMYAGPTTTRATTSAGDPFAVVADEIISVTNKANNLIAELRKLQEDVQSVPSTAHADASKQSEWAKKLKSMDVTLARMRQSRDECRSSASVVSRATLPVRDLGVDSMDLALLLIRECISARSK